MKQLYPLVLSLFFACCNNATAQTGTITAVDPYFAETGDTVSTHGPQTITRNTLQDRNGNYWFATWQGIIRYDGKTFTNLTLKENLIHFHVFYVFEDTKGNIWFGTIRGGLYRYDGKTFTLFTTNDGLADNSVTCMAEDKAGNIWFGTNDGASRYDGKTFSSFKKQDGPGDNRIACIYKDKTGRLWFAGADGVYYYDGSSFSEFKNKDGLSFKTINSIAEDKAGKMWLGGMEGAGLWCYDPEAKNENAFTSFMSYFIGYMLVDKKGNLWLTVSEPQVPASKYEKAKYNPGAVLL